MKPSVLSRPGPWEKTDTLIAGLLTIGTVLSRWPFQIDILNNHDAVNYALALGHFDMRLHQPQPPGYPLYILFGRAFDLFLHDHLAALVWLSTVSSGLGVLVIYLAGREMFGRRAGIVAALLVTTSSPIWFQGEIAAPYTTDLLASALVGWLCFRLANSPHRRTVWAAALALGLAGAFRLQTFVFLFPLFLYALRSRGWKTIVSATALAGGVFGAFFVPAVMVSGGPAAFVESMRVTVPIFYSADALVKSTRLSRFVGNAINIAKYTFRTLGELALPFALLGWLARPQRLRFWCDPRLTFLAIWTVPTWIVYFLIWPGNPGTILVCMPAVFILAATGLDWALNQPRWIRITGWAALSAMLVWRVALFTFLPQYPFGDAYRRFDNHESVTSIADYYHTKLALTQEIPVEGTIVYANAFRHLQYYLPQYRAFSAPSLQRSDPRVVKRVVSIQNGAMETWTDRDAAAIVPPDTRRIIFFDLPPEILLADPSLVETKSRGSHSIRVASVPADAQVLWTQEGLTINIHE